MKVALLPQQLKKLRSLLRARYGQPETYGICYNFRGDELSGCTYRLDDIGLMVSFDTRRPKVGTTTVLVSFHSTERLAPSDPWYGILSKRWDGTATAVAKALHHCKDGLYATN